MGTAHEAGPKKSVVFKLHIEWRAIEIQGGMIFKRCK